MAPSTPEPRRVKAPWKASYDPALKVKSGQSVTLGRSDPDNPGWRWVENAEGLGGWLPVDALDGDQVTEDFDTMELTVLPGEWVQPLSARAGWVLVRHSDGREGWLPEAVLA